MIHLIALQVFTFVRAQNSTGRPHRAACHVCECSLEFQTKVERTAPLNVWVSRAAWLEVKAANHSKVVFRWRSNAPRGPEEAMDGRMAELRREIQIQPEKAGRGIPSTRSAPSLEEALSNRGQFLLLLDFRVCRFVAFT
ncbi:hypothetical protein BHE74_00030870 [Ensete ventricosum]|nr:hypothetical protein BHE74_00030870 [Ensete ventricosum]